MAFCAKSNQSSYPFVLPELPYSKDSFVPHFTKETFEYHHEKHHQTYVTNLNNLLKENTDLQKMDLEELIVFSHEKNIGIFNNAAQIWNHTFFWHSIKPNGGGAPSDKLSKLIEDAFGSVEDFKEQFKQAALSQFGSGWAWLVLNSAGKLEIVKTSNAQTPFVLGTKPLLACDVWEHAYYIDYRNRRADYVSIYLDKMINWDFAESNL